MNPTERERSLPLFLLLSMALHGLLFLYAPQLVGGLFPSAQPGDQGGVTFITLVDAPALERPRAAVAEAARRPQARPTPQALPEPKPPAEQVLPERVAAAAQPAPEPRPVQVEEVIAERTAPEPAHERPQPVQAAAAPRPAPEQSPVAERPEPAAPVVTQAPPVASAPAAAPEPVLTSEHGENAVAAAPSATLDSAAGSAGAPSVPAGETRRAEAPPQRTAAGDTSAAGGDARSDVASAAPDAEIAPQAQPPPTGESMVRDFGGHTFPKNAVGLVSGAVTVEVAAIVGEDGHVIEVVLISGSGISVVDNYALNVVQRGIPFKPYDSPYEARVLITFDSRQEHLIFRYDGLIKSPPTVGRLAAGGAR